MWTSPETLIGISRALLDIIESESVKWGCITYGHENSLIGFDQSSKSC